MAIDVVWALAGIFCAVVLAGIGSARGVGLAGQAAAGGMSETPQNFGKYLILVALPGTQGIYGFAIAFLFFLRLNAVKFMLAPGTGLYFLLGSLPVALGGLVSGIFQGMTCASAIMMTGKQPKESTKGLIFAVIIEFYAILGFVISFFVWLWLLQSDAILPK